ncbi:FIG00649665: hypothetical protein [hydrothermal vent metagenome]|uniref:DUF5683 domain-containing protein n=1 Tax=hydrothermal vent metagenome TaxID=652676 RepID=A0A3B0TPQ2_9ZZZZ
MVKNLAIAVFFVLFAMTSFGQEEETNTQEVDSLKTDPPARRAGLKSEGLLVIDTLVSKKKEINPLAPSKAAFYSAVLPGLGQIYNKRYWKVPIVYIVLGTGVYAYTFNNTQYNRWRDAFKRRKAGFTDDEFWDFRTPDDGMIPATPDFDIDDLENQQERFQRDRDLALLVTIIMYALNVVDANVDAHLKQFNIDDDLSFDFEVQPYLDVNPITNNPNYGLALTLKF